MTAEAFEESQRALAEAEMAVADLRAELERAEQARDDAKPDGERAHVAHAKATNVEHVGQLVADLLTRMDRL